LSAEGATRDEDVDKLALLLRDRLSNGAEIVAAEVQARVVESPLIKYSYMFNFDKMFAKVVEIMKENRRKDDEDHGYL
jgi:hypothetical protein